MIIQITIHTVVDVYIRIHPYNYYLHYITTPTYS